MGESESSQPSPHDPTAYDPWASTVPVPASDPAEPPPAAASTPTYPSTLRYPYPGLTSGYATADPYASQLAPTSGSFAGAGPHSGAGLYPGADQEPVIATIGEIQVTASTIRTPAGAFPLQGSQWTVSDQWITEQKIPTWAIVMSVVGFFFMAFFSLLFLLARTTVYRAVVQVHVASGPYQYVARIPAGDQTQVQYLYQQVNYVRSLAAR